MNTTHRASPDVIAAGFVSPRLGVSSSPRRLGQRGSWEEPLAESHPLPFEPCCFELCDSSPCPASLLLICIYALVGIMGIYWYIFVDFYL